MGDRAAFIAHYRRWCVPLAGFLLTILVFAPLNCFNFFFVYIRADLNLTAVEAGWVSSTMIATSCLGSSVSAGIETYTGYRLATVLGTILVLSSLFLSTLVSAIHLLCLFLGIGYGMGVNLCTHGLICVLLKTFPTKHRTRASAIPILAHPLGIMVFNVVYSYLLPNFGWRVTLQLTAAMVLATSLPLSFLITEGNESISPRIHPTTGPPVTQYDEDHRKNNENGPSNIAYISGSEPNKGVDMNCQIRDSTQIRTSPVILCLDHIYSYDVETFKHTGGTDMTESASWSEESYTSTEEYTTASRDENHPETDEGALRKDVIGNTNTVAYVNQTFRKDEKGNFVQEKMDSKKLEYLKEMSFLQVDQPSVVKIWLHLAGKSEVWCLGISAIFTCIAWSVFLVYMVSFLESTNTLDGSSILLLMTVSAFADLVVRSTVMFVGDKLPLTKPILTLYFIGGLISVPLCIGYASSPSFEMLIVLRIVTGMCKAFMAMFHVAAVDVFDGDYTDQCVTLMMNCNGIGYLIGPVIAGMIFDASSSYTLVFYMNAAFFLISNLLLGNIFIKTLRSSKSYNIR